MLAKTLYPIDKLINKVTMYRLLLYYLVGLIAAAMALSAAGIMHYSPVDIAVSAAILVFSCWLINKILAAIFYAPVNPESSILTGLILALILPSQPTGLGLLFLLAAAGLAMASKYVLSIRGKHIFNPAAIAAFLTAVGPHQSASWWVGTAAMLPFVIVGGLLVMRKIRREPMVLTFIAVTSLTTVVLALITSVGVGVSMKNMVLNSAAFFLGFVMLTEPYTAPDTRLKRLIYASIVGIIIAPQVHIGHYYASPEAALLIGNLFAYLSSNKTKLFPVLRKKYMIAKDSAEFAFAPERKFAYAAGQYMEFTLPHDKTDSRGARRYFTLSSSPTEPDIKIGVRFYKDGSTFKSALADIEPGEFITAGQLSGDFVLPKDKREKLAFIAGGIGITPFRSMIKYLIDTKERRDIVLLYAASDPEHLAYVDLFEQARSNLGINTIYVLSDYREGKVPSSVNGRITRQSIQRLVPDFGERRFYISGPLALTENVREDLDELGVSRANIKIDFFSGY